MIFIERKMIDPRTNGNNGHPVVQKNALPDLENYKCPKCGEQMLPKDGKDYYTCSKHWSYPDMILKGEVRDKKY